MPTGAIYLKISLEQLFELSEGINRSPEKVSTPMRKRSRHHMVGKGLDTEKEGISTPRRRASDRCRGGSPYVEGVP